LDRELGDGLDGGGGDGAGPANVVGTGDVGAFDEDLVHTAGEAVDTGVLGVAVDAGGEGDECHPVADGAGAAGSEVERELIELVAADVHADLGVFGFEEGRVGE